jgi:hypothetical protein
LVRIDKMESNIVTIDDLPIELVVFIFNMLQMIDLKTCVSVCYKWCDCVKSSKAYKSNKYKRLRGFEYTYALALSGHLNMLKLAVIDWGIPVNGNAYLAAIDSNSLGIVKFLHEQGVCISLPTHKTFEYAIQRNRMDILQQLINLNKPPISIADLICSTAMYNNLPALEILKKHYPLECGEYFKQHQGRNFLELFNIALTHNGLLMAEYCLLELIEKHPEHLDDAFSGYRCRNILWECNFETYTWLKNKFALFKRKFPSDKTIADSLGRTNCDLMMRFYDSSVVYNKIDTDLNNWKRYISFRNNKVALQWLFDHGVKFNVEDYVTVDERSSKTYLDVLKWLYHKVGPDTSSWTIQMISHIDNLKLAKWVHRHGFNCNIDTTYKIYHRGYKVMCWLYDPNLGAVIPAESFKREILNKFVAMTNSHSDSLKLDPDFLKLYELFSR